MIFFMKEVVISQTFKNNDFMMRLRVTLWSDIVVVCPKLILF